jgi:hypothetical protein
VLNSTQVDNNTASHTSGAGIVNHGTMTLNKSEVNGNTAAGTGVSASGGGIISAQGPPGSVSTALTLNNSKVNNNTAGGDGGGIANGIRLPGPMPLIGGALTLNHSQVTGDTAAHGRHLQQRRNGDPSGLWGARTASMTSGLRFPGQAGDLHAARSYPWISPPTTLRRRSCGVARSVRTAGIIPAAPGGRRFPRPVRAMLVVLRGVLVQDPGAGAAARRSASGR